MKKFLLILLLFFGLTGILLRNLSFAQESNKIKVKSEPIELDITAIYIPCENPADPICQPYPDNVTHPDPANVDHELYLENEGFPPNTEVYITGCINTNSGIHCTTGDEGLDTMLNSLPGGDTMIPDLSYQFKALHNPVRTDQNGNLSIIVRSFTPQVTSHTFNAYLVYDQDNIPTSIAVGPSVTPDSAIHLQTFANLTPTRTPIVVRPRIVQRRNHEQDPKGRLFDIKSLEPVTGIEVTLLDNFRNLFNYKNLVNPQLVQTNGEFNFWVPNGIYYLQFAKLPETHTWPIEIKDVHSNYALAYYCDPDVKDSQNQPVPLYYNQFSIIEFNKLVHCDVPIDPGTNAPWRSSVRTLDYGLNRNPLNGSFTFSGKVTHPFTKIQLVGQSMEKVVQETEADKFGFWRTTVAAINYPLTPKGVPDNIILRYLKKDLTTNQFQEPIGGLTMEPLLSYVEGYAYDRAGNIIPNAKVGVKQKNSDKVVYLTTGDNHGYFRIGTQYLPSLPYDLIFSNGEDSLKAVLTSSQFLEANAQYLQDKQLNLVNTQNKEVPLTTSSVSSFKALKSTSPIGKKVQSDDNQAGQQTQSFIPLILISTLLILSGVGAYFLILKKRTNLPNL